MTVELGSRQQTAQALWRRAGAHVAAGDPAAAALDLKAAAALAPDSVDLWIDLGDALHKIGAVEDASDAYMHGVRAGVNEPALAEAAGHLAQGRLAPAEQILRKRLWDHPTDVAAIRMLGELAARLGRNDDAIRLLRRSIELAPGFDAAREFLARLMVHAQPLEALEQIEALIRRAPGNLSHQMLKASVLVRLGDQAQAKAIYEDLLRIDPGQPKVWMSLGHVLKTLGLREEAVTAYREAIARQPDLGEAWWSLANLKTFRFTPQEVAAMQAAADRAAGVGQEGDEDDRMHLHFALGKALEDAGDDEAAFRRYETGNRLRRAQLPYSAQDAADQCERLNRLFTPAFLDARADQGCPTAGPIFIVGLPRSGSTLVEQILSSHSQVEGTMELPDLMSIAARLRTAAGRSGQAAYPESLADLDPEALQALGREYLERTRAQRKTDRPFFIDKMPNNWQHVGLIQLILPNARIIDARRHPIGCCFSAWKQHFARGQAFSYGLEDVALYYRDYVGLMAAFGRAAPGRVHRVVYERMVQDTEGEVRRLLAYLGLPFEDDCLAFWRNQRPVRTASSEQVRQPIFTDAMEHWRRFEPWLGPMIDILEPVLPAYAEM